MAHDSSRDDTASAPNLEQAPSGSPQLSSPEPGASAGPGGNTGAGGIIAGGGGSIGLLTQSAESRLTTHFLAAMMIIASLVMVLWNLQDSSLRNANTGSRYATIESLVDYGTYHIDRSKYVHTIDRMKVGDNYISSKPALLPTYAAGVYWVYQKVTGKTIAEHEGDVVRTVSFFTGWLFHAVFLLYLYRFCLALFSRQLAILGTLAVGAFGYLGVAYATTINNHSTSAAFVMMGLYHAYRARHGGPGYAHWIFAGLALGISGAVDLSTLAFAPTVGLYLLLKDWRRAVFGFGLACLPGVIAMFGLNYHITGSLKPTYTNSDLKDFADNYFRTRRSGIDALREPKTIYAWNVLLGHHGVFSMTPVFCFGLYELIRSLKKRSYLPEALVVTAVLAAAFYFYIFRTRNYGGWCVGMRWLVPFMPLFILYLGRFLDRIRLDRLTLGAVTLAFGVGCFHVQDGLTSPFQYSVWHNWIEGQPNRARVGKTFNVSKTKKSKPKKKKKPKRAPEK